MIDTSRLHEAVAVSAYYKAEQRGFWPGHEIEDWLEAERELQSLAAVLHPEANA